VRNGFEGNREHLETSQMRSRTAKKYGRTRKLEKIRMTDLESLQRRKGALHLLEDFSELQTFPLEGDPMHMIMLL
jgi:hypothetical protein